MKNEDHAFSNSIGFAELKHVATKKTNTFV